MKAITEMQIEPFKKYKAIVKYRRGEGFDVHADCESADGLTLSFISGWEIHEEDSNVYSPGEWAMRPLEEKDIDLTNGRWVATGDLVNIELVE